MDEKDYKIYMRKYQKKEKCQICQKFRDASNFDELPCGHQICKKCLENYIQSELEKNIKITEIECPRKDCFEYLTETIVQKYDDTLERVSINCEISEEDYNSQEKSCQMCFQRFNPNDSIKMECSHAFCKSCIEQKFQERCLETNEIEKILKCLEKNCLQPMSLDNLKPVISDKLYLDLIKMQPKLPKLSLVNQSVSLMEKMRNNNSNLTSYDPNIIQCGICLEKVKSKN